MKIELNIFNRDSLKKAIKEIEDYKQSLKRKTALFVQRLVEEGIPVIHERIASAQGDFDDNHNVYVKINGFGTYSRAVLVLQGRDMMFVEFGAGVYYNGFVGGSPHPRVDQDGLPYRIGTYNDNGNGWSLGQYDSWYYTDETGVRTKTHGTEATMPMYSASVEIMRKYKKIAKEVFET